MYFFKRYFYALICLLFISTAILLPGCSDNSNEMTFDKKIVVLTSADNPPFEFFKTSSGQPQIVGYDIDLIHMIADYLGWTIEIQDIDFSSIIPALSTGRGDIGIAGFSATPKRAKNMEFSKPYYSAKLVMIIPVDSDFKELSNLSGKKVGVQLGTSLEQFAYTWAGSNPGVTIVPLNKLGNIIQDVLVGRLDAAIFEETPAASFVDSNPTLKSYPLQSMSDGFAMAFPKGSELVGPVNKAIDHLKESGALDVLTERWLKTGV
jgi:polar amino acid transport system substrate-binding protein